MLEPIIEIEDIIRDIVAQLGYTVTITNNVDNGGGNHVLTVENTYYLTKAKIVEIDGFDYEVTDFTFNQDITVKPLGHTNPITVDSFNLPAPLYFHGTVKSTDKEIIKEMEASPNSYPIVYLYKPITETVNKSNRLALNSRTVPIQIFFLDISNYEDFLNIDFLNEVIKPLGNVEANFLKVLENEKGIGQINQDYNRFVYERFARTDQNGEINLIFSEELSAIQNNIVIPIRKC